MGKQKQQKSGGLQPVTPPFYNELHKAAAPLLDQQMWFWGCDARRENGNLLLAYGMERRPSPEPRFRSAYTHKLDENTALTLWGWGIWIASGENGSVFVSRSRFHVRYSREAILKPQAWCEYQIPKLHAPQDEMDWQKSRHLLAVLFSWIGDYEHWLKTQVQPNYRELTLSSWPQRRHHRGGTPAAEIAYRWAELAQAAAGIPAY